MTIILKKIIGSHFWLNITALNNYDNIPNSIYRGIITRKGVVVIGSALIRMIANR